MPVRPGPQRRTLLAAAGLAWAVFGGLLWAVQRSGGPDFDRSGLLFWRRHASPVLDKLAVFLTIVGNTGPMIAVGILVVGWLLWRGHRMPAWVFGLSVGGSMLLTQLLKPLVARPRPALWVSLRPEHTLSFPSGHAMDTAAIATAVGFLLWQRRAPGPALVPAALFALAVGWARVYLGVHYPSDVLAGWAAAAGWVLLIQLLMASGLPPSAADDELPAAGRR